MDNYFDIIFITEANGQFIAEWQRNNVGQSAHTGETPSAAIDAVIAANKQLESAIIYCRYANDKARIYVTEISGQNSFQAVLTINGGFVSVSSGETREQAIKLAARSATMRGFKTNQIEVEG